MNKFIAATKRIRLGQVIMTFLAGILLFVTTACNAVQAKDSGAVTGSRQETPAGKLAVPGQKNPRPEVPGGTVTSPSSDVINRFQGETMNEFSDVDPRAEKLDAAARQRGQELKENSAQNLEKRADSVDKYVRNYREGTPFGERVKNLGEDVGSSAEQLTDRTQRGVENIKGNAQDATRGVSKSASRATDKAAENTKASGKNIVDSAQRAIENASEAVQRQASQAADTTKRALD